MSGQARDRIPTWLAEKESTPATCDEITLPPLPQLAPREAASGGAPREIIRDRDLECRVEVSDELGVEWL
jgi:hypothetical protein